MNRIRCAMLPRYIVPAPKYRGHHQVCYNFSCMHIQDVITFDEGKRKGFLALISEISSAFVDVPYQEMNQRIDSSLQRIADFLQLDRTTLLLLDSKSENFVFANVAGRIGLGPVKAFSEKEAPWVFQEIRGGKEVRLSNISDIPEEASNDRSSYTKMAQDWSVLLIPLKGRDRVIGAHSFGIAKEGIWPEELVEHLRVAAQVFANALFRRYTEEHLNQALDEVQQLKDQLQRENVYLREEVELLHSHRNIIFRSSVMRSVLAKVEQVGSTNSTVLLIGETGTGKELIASAIHDVSDRRERTMVRVNCAAIPESLIESELFGREKGAYTGALTKQLGRFELADGSSIFLDEITELSPEVQAKLLRVLQEREIERLGNPKPIPINVRVIAAANQNLLKAVQEGRFRMDLFYRLNVFPIHVPPLRERTEDIPVLVWAFINEFAQDFGKKIESVPKDVLEALTRYAWPGNVRELRNTVERAMILSNGPNLTIETPMHYETPSSHPLSLQEIEIQHIRKVLEMTRWRIRGKNGSAEILNMKPSTLESRMAKLGIFRPK